jgi:hypothetical protein
MSNTYNNNTILIIQITPIIHQSHIPHKLPQELKNNYNMNKYLNYVNNNIKNGNKLLEWLQNNLKDINKIMDK